MAREPAGLSGQHKVTYQNRISVQVTTIYSPPLLRGHKFAVEVHESLDFVVRVWRFVSCCFPCWRLKAALSRSTPEIHFKGNDAIVYSNVLQNGQFTTNTIYNICDLFKIFIAVKHSAQVGYIYGRYSVRISDEILSTFTVVLRVYYLCFGQIHGE
jgi:hypothetical protein